MTTDVLLVSKSDDEGPVDRYGEDDVRMGQLGGARDLAGAMERGARRTRESVAS